MEQTALRPKPLPGQEPGGGTRPCPARRPRAAHRRGRPLTTLLLGVLAGTVLVLSGAGLATMGATVIGMSRLAELQGQTAGQGAPGHPSYSAHPGPSPSRPAPARVTLGVEAVDAEKRGALVVGVHVPGPGYTAGLVRGDVLLVFGDTRVDSAADLARAVAEASPGAEIGLMIRHESGDYQQLTAVPGVST